jgi:hypothetical protein
MILIKRAKWRRRGWIGHITDARRCKGNPTEAVAKQSRFQPRNFKKGSSSAFCISYHEQSKLPPMCDPYVPFVTTLDRERECCTLPLPSNVRDKHLSHRFPAEATLHFGNLLVFQTFANRTWTTLTLDSVSFLFSFFCLDVCSWVTLGRMHHGEAMFIDAIVNSSCEAPVGVHSEGIPPRHQHQRFNATANETRQ